MEEEVVFVDLCSDDESRAASTVLLSDDDNNNSSDNEFCNLSDAIVNKSVENQQETIPTPAKTDELPQLCWNCLEALTGATAVCGKCGHLFHDSCHKEDMRCLICDCVYPTDTDMRKVFCEFTGSLPGPLAELRDSTKAAVQQHQQAFEMWETAKSNIKKIRKAARSAVSELNEEEERKKNENEVVECLLSKQTRWMNDPALSSVPKEESEALRPVLENEISEVQRLRKKYSEDSVVQVVLGDCKVLLREILEKNRLTEEMEKKMENIAREIEAARRKKEELAQSRAKIETAIQTARKRKARAAGITNEDCPHRRPRARAVPL
eukprot:Rmarinus@m.23484